MPNAASHCASRGVICAVCFKKGSSMRTLGPSGLERIHKHHDPLYDIQDERYPSALCARCHKLLFDIESGKKEKSCLPLPTDFRSTIVPTAITQTSPQCQCLLCEKARFNPIGAGQGPHRVRPHQIGRSSSIPDPLPHAQPVKICQRCHCTRK